MTTKEINEHIQKVTTEINKLKRYCTKLAKKLKENDIEVPAPNWKETEEENKND